MLHELEVGFEQHGPAHDRDDDGRLKAQRLAGEERPFAAGKLIAACDDEGHREPQRLAVEERAGVNYKAADGGKWFSPPRTASPKAESSATAR